jgi:hypothetical protein
VYRNIIFILEQYVTLSVLIHEKYKHMNTDNPFHSTSYESGRNPSCMLLMPGHYPQL